MTAAFEFATATRIVFGPGKVRAVAPAARDMGCRALVVTGKSQERAAALIHDLAAHDVSATLFSVAGEPTLEAARAGVELGRGQGCNLVIGYGGGSPLDCGKAIAAILGNGGDPLDYIEVIGKGLPLNAPPLPFIAVPTTAGTGSEVTRNAVLASAEHRVKASVRSPLMLPKLAVIDPELTLDLPPDVTASTGLDALTQVIEPYVSSRHNAMTDLFCLDGIRRAARSLQTAYQDGRNLEARTDMAMTSLLGGLALANAGLGVVHGFAAPVGGMFPAPHGAVCAALLPGGIRINLEALRDREPESDALTRYETVARLLTGDPAATPEDGLAWITQVASELAIPGLSTYGLTPADLPAVVEKAARASSMKANPIVLTAPELTTVIRSAM